MPIVVLLQVGRVGVEEICLTLTPGFKSVEPLCHSLGTHLSWLCKENSLVLSRNRPFLL